MVEADAGRWPRLIRFALLLVLVPGSVLAYAALAMTINGQPPYSPFHGWVAVMQPPNKSSRDQVQLLVQTFGSGSHPLVSYTVGICGPQPYNGDLLIGQDARLSHTGSVSEQPGSPTIANIPQTPIQQRPVKFGVAGVSSSAVFYQSSNIGPVQVAPINANPSSCLQTGAVSDEQAWVAGYLSVPIQQSSEGPFALWHGPNLSQTWPMIGAPPDVFPGFNYSFQGSYKESSLPGGFWVLPAKEQVQVTRFGAPVSWSVNTAQPAAVSSSPLMWSSNSAIQPMARLTDSSSMATLQDWIVVAAVVVGIGGSLLAGMVFAAPGRRRATAAATYAPGGPSPPPERPLRSPGPAVRASAAGPVAGIVVVSTAIVIGLVRYWHTRRHT